ncbi:DJ-1/PfpI family protein [Actinophytocola oryzae]|uniref:DJ-1/PfpI family protein n=1 Tax=Actinophytocola oryzae TaxID=502181 RepID=A0A4R7VYX0_9PSEU|nr:DJ-1/PfpI family protein [Actinophytocola oryzae]TDV54868.1 DJ-1/PfpI family protein [Actinophytocola oryzae]
MRIAILLFDRVTSLDAVGPYEVLRFAQQAEVVFTGKEVGQVRAGAGTLGLMVDKELSEVPSADVLIVPGGPGQVDLMTDTEVLEWLRQVDQTTTWTASVCTGSLVLAAAGLLRGRKATSHWLALDQLPEFGAEPVEQRVVFDGKYVTAAGVSAGIDMGFQLAGRIAGDVAAQYIQLGLEYDPQPLHDAGSPARAPAAIVADMRENSHLYLRDT